MWDARTGKAEHVLQTTAAVISLSFSNDGARVASAAIDGAIYLWDSRTGAFLRQILHEFVVANRDGWVEVSLNFSPTGRSLTVAGTAQSNRFDIFDADSGERISSISGCTFAVHSPDGRMIATVDPVDECMVHLIDAVSGTNAFRLRGHGGAFVAAAFSPDGSKLASGGWDISVWSSLTGGLLNTIEDRSLAGGLVRSLAWGRDWAWDTQETQGRGTAFAMGQHPRLGEGSDLLGLEPGVVRMILDRVGRVGSLFPITDH
jgi:WD40 repeat protein